MRISEQSKTNHRLTYLQTASEQLERIQQQLATGKKLSRISDDPASGSLVMRHRETIAFEAQMRRNLEGGRAFINASEAALGTANDTLQRVRELTIQAANSTLSTDERGAIAAEVDQLIGHLAQVANTNFGGAYVFSGHRTDQPAYAVAGNPPIAVTFQGDSGARIRRISREDAVAVNVTGDAVFGTLFDDLITLRNNLQSSVPAATIAASLTALDAGLGRIIDARADLGARANRFEAAENLSLRTDTDLQQLRASVEEVDLGETVVRFTAAQNALQSALAAIGRTSEMSLLNFLR
jgi:flagellar hook-associated protein 3 FlgL